MYEIGRSRTLHAWQQEDVTPDIQTLGKGHGGGYAPIAAMMMNHRIVVTLDRSTGKFMHGQTYRGHPVACPASFGVQNIIESRQLVAKVAVMGKLHEEGLKANLGNRPKSETFMEEGYSLALSLSRTSPPSKPLHLKWASQCESMQREYKNPRISRSIWVPVPLMGVSAILSFPLTTLQNTRSTT